MKNLLLVLIFVLVGCSAAGDDFGVSQAPLVGTESEDPNGLTFWWYSSADPDFMRATLECALDRVRQATCLPVDVSFDAWHWFSDKPDAQMPTLVGQSVTHNAWINSRIYIRESVVSGDASLGYACGVLVHEIGEHVLRRSGTHAAGYNNDNRLQLFEQVLTDICAIHDCECFQPEL